MILKILLCAFAAVWLLGLFIVVRASNRAPIDPKSDEN